MNSACFVGSKMIIRNSLKMLMAARQTDKHVGLRHADQQAHILSARHTCKHARTHDLTHIRLYAKGQAGMLAC